MRRRTFLFTLLALMIPLPGAASNEILRLQLKEGTRVFIREMKTPSAAFTLWSRGGSAFETEPGQALLTARLLNRTLRNRLEARGLDTSPSVCVTSDTCFLTFQVASSSTEPAMVALGEALRAPDYSLFEREKARLMAELARGKKDPLRLAYGQLLNKAYPNHPYGRALEGNPSNLTIDKLRAYFNRTYQTLSLVEAGGASSGTLIGTLAYSFSGVAANATPSAIPSVVPQNGTSVLSLEGAPASAVALGTAGPDFGQFREGVTLEILARLLQNQLQGPKVWWDFRQGPGLFAIAFQGDRTDVDQWSDRALIAIENVRNGSIPPLDLSKAQDEILASFEEPKQDPGPLSQEIGRYATLGNLTALDTRAPIVRQITASEVQEVALKYLGPSRMVISKVYKK